MAQISQNCKVVVDEQKLHTSCFLPIQQQSSRIAPDFGKYCSPPRTRQANDEHPESQVRESFKATAPKNPQFRIGSAARFREEPAWKQNTVSPQSY